MKNQIGSTLDVTEPANLCPDEKAESPQDPAGKDPSCKRLGRPPRGTEGEVTVRMLEAATTTFMKEGFEAASIDAIVAAAGASKKTFYARFSGKDDLFEAVFMRFLEREMALVERLVDDMQGSARGRLHRIALALLTLALKPDTVAFRRIAIAETTRFPHFARVMHDFGFPRIAFLVQKCLNDGVHRGEFIVEDTRFAAEFFLHSTVLGQFDRATSGIDKPGMTYTKREHLRRSVEFFLKACLSPDPAL